MERSLGSVPSERSGGKSTGSVGASSSCTRLSLVDFGVVVPTSKTAKFVPGIEAWTGDISQTDPRDPQDASNVGKYVSRFMLREGVRASMAALDRAGGFAAIAHSVEQGDS